MANLKRLWDTEKKRVVFTEGPTGHQCQVWTNDDGSKLYIYDMAQWLVYNGSNPAKTFGPSDWVAMTDDMVGFYDTNVPTDLYNWDSGDEAAYRFLNGTTVLQSGKVDEGETPEYTGDTPTKSSTVPYVEYEFTGWKPTVGPIYKKTDFKAQFSTTEYPIVNECEATSEQTIELFSDEIESIITVDKGTDPETGDLQIVVNPQGIFENDFYFNEGVNENVWSYALGNIYMYALEKLIEYAADHTTLPNAIFSAAQTLYTTPTQANAEALTLAIRTYFGLENEIEISSEAIGGFFNEVVSYNIELDAGTGEKEVVPFSSYSDDDGINGFIGVITTIDEAAFEKAFMSAPEGIDEGVFTDAAMALINAIYLNPSEANTTALVTAITAYYNDEGPALVAWNEPEPETPTEQGE